MTLIDSIKSIDFSRVLNYIVNITIVVLIIYSIYNLYNEYSYYKEFDSNNITKSDDFEIITSQYSDCLLPQFYSNLSKRDKEYFEYLINYTTVKYKEDKPSFKKKINKFKTNIIINVLITLFLTQKLSSTANTFKHSVLLTTLV